MGRRDACNGRLPRKICGRGHACRCRPSRRVPGRTSCTKPEGPDRQRRTRWPAKTTATGLKIALQRRRRGATKGSQVVRTIGRLHTMVKFLRKVAFVTRQVTEGTAWCMLGTMKAPVQRLERNPIVRRRQDIPTKRRKLRREVGLDETRRPCNMPTRRQSQRVRSTGRSSTAAWDCVSRARPLGGTARVRSVRTTTQRPRRPLSTNLHLPFPESFFVRQNICL